MSSPEVQPSVEPTTMAQLVAELAGTFLLVFGLVGTATFSAFFGEETSNPLGVGFLGVAVALGLSVTIAAYAFGPISGGHFNPAVTLGLAAAGRFPWRATWTFVLAQLVGAFLGALAVFGLAAGGPDGFLDRAVSSGFVSNGFGELSPGGFGLVSAIVVEVVITAVFLYVILGVTHNRAAPGFAPIAIGATLTLLLLVAIPIDNGSVNPARSIATAVFAGGDWLAQVWVFIVFPVIGALIAGFSYRILFGGTRPVGARPVANRG
ncbi:aquaporin [Plantibacter sp. LMC-P-059a]|uniref:aquaporin n=1 Tax=Plantibacter sp. LMC-P-059a TaxID=3040297 RepID=UPI00254F839F|nr:aquaporin [Plantibacter sp. LMC-P-059a]